MLKRFIPYYKPHKKLFFLDLLAALLVALIDLVFPLFSKTAINDYIPNGKIKSLILTGAVIVFLYVIRYGAQFFMSYWGHIVGARMEYDMRKELFSHLQTQDIAFFDRMRTGQLMNRMMGSLRDIAELAHHGPEDLFLAVIMLTGSFFILLRINVALTLIVFFFVFALLIFTFFKRRAMRSAMRVVREYDAQMNSKLENSISGIRLSRSFANEAYEVKDFDGYNGRHLDSRSGFYFAMGKFLSGSSFLTDLITLVTLVVGGYFVYLKEINFGELVAFILYAGYFVQPVRRLIQFMQQYEEGMTGFERFIEVLDVKPTILDKENPYVLTNVKGSIVFDKVSFSYPSTDQDTLVNFSLEVQPGKSVALVGQSGVGKSTIAKLLLRFYDVNKGSILLDGCDLRDIELASLRNSMGLVEQDVFIYYGTVKDNIKYGKLHAGDEEVIESAKKANIHEFIMELPYGYDTIVGERGIKLSGGQKQRLAIARIFLKNPKILILDEATSSLDNENEQLIQSALDELAKGRTTLTIAHRLSTIVSSDEIIVMGKEGVVERGSHSELLSKAGEYSALYQAQRN